MNVASDNQQLIRSASQNNVNATGLKSVKDRSKQQKTNSTVATTPSERKTDTVQISKASAELSRSSSTIDTDYIESYTDNRSEDKRASSGGIESVMAKYKEAQDFMAQIAFESIDSTA